MSDRPPAMDDRNPFLRLSFSENGIPAGDTIDPDEPDISQGTIAHDRV